IASSRTSASRRLFCVRRCFLHHDAAHRNLHSFPTRRSSDLEDYSDKDGWDSITLASTFGGMAINQAGVAAPHGLEHPASGLRNIDRKSTHLNTSHVSISYAVFCLKKKNTDNTTSRWTDTIQ